MNALRCGVVVLLTTLSFAGFVQPASSQAGIGDLFGAIIQNAMIRETWNRLGPEMNTCLGDAFRKEGTSVDALAARGVPADQQQIRPYIDKCNGMIGAAREWRATNAKAKSCVATLLQANNQTINGLAEMGVGPSNPQVRALFSECEQIDAAKTAWSQVEGKLKGCLTNLLSRNGQTIDQLADRRIGPTDPQLSSSISDCQQMDAARLAWLALDTNVRACVVRVLSRNGQSIEMLAEGKIGPADSKVSPMMGQCQLISSQSLLKNVSCVIEGQPSQCDEAYVLESAQGAALDQEQLVTALIANQPVGTVSLDLPAPKRARLAAISQRLKEALADEGLRRLAPLADPANKFSHLRAVDLQSKIDSARENPKTTEGDLLKLEGETRALSAANVEEIERQRVRKAEMAARGEVEVIGRGAGANRKSALAGAYLDVLDGQLRELIGSQADADLAAARALGDRDRDSRLMDIQSHENDISHQARPPCLRLGAGQPGAILD